MNTLFSSKITERSKLNLSTRNSANLCKIFDRKLLQLVKRLGNSLYTCHNLMGT